MQTQQPTDPAWIKAVANWKIGFRANPNGVLPPLTKIESALLYDPDRMSLFMPLTPRSQLTTHPLSEHQRVFGERLSSHDAEYGRG